MPAQSPLESHSYAIPSMDQGLDQNRQYSKMPYEVYETIHGPRARRRRWAVRLVAALLAVTLLIIGGTALRSKLHSPGSAQVTQSNGAGRQGATSNGSGQRPDAASQQAPQANAPLQKSDSNPVTTPQSGIINTGTVNQPE